MRVFTGYKPKDFLKEFPEEFECDAVVVGAGPNGLISALYLASAGLKVIVCEKRYEIGGGLATEEILFPSNLSNTHAVYHMMVDYMPVLKDFKLDEYGLDWIKPNSQVSFISPDGFYLTFHRMVQDSKDSVGKISIEEAERFEGNFRLWRRMVDEILAPATYVPPLPPLEMIEKFQRTDIGKKFLDLAEKSPAEIIDESFKSEKLKALIAYLVGMWGVDLEETGMGFMVPLLVVRATQKCYPYGGSHRFASSLARKIIGAGGLILDNAEVEKILVEGGEIKGVQLTDGRKIFSKIVASSLPAPLTFEKLTEIPDSAKEIAESLKQWKWDKWSFFTVHFTSPNPPHCKVNKELDKFFVSIVGFSDFQNVLSYFGKLKEGKFTPVGGHFTPESLIDETLSRDGKFVSFLQVCAPYPSDKEKEKIGKELLDILSDYFEFEVDMFVCESPKDIESRLASMPYGSIKHGDYTPSQMGYFRPTEECSSSATPIKGLYLCGASSYPGGLIIGGPGYIAANRICDDLKVQKWWQPPDYIRKFLKEYY